MYEMRKLMGVRLGAAACAGLVATAMLGQGAGAPAAAGATAATGGTGVSVATNGAAGASGSSNFDPQARSKAILAHLNDVIRYYHTMKGPMQQVGEPSDVLYEEQGAALATQATQMAFQSARAEAALMAANAKRERVVEKPDDDDDPDTPPLQEQQRMQDAAARMAKRVSDLKAQKVELEGDIQHPGKKKVADLQAQLAQVNSALSLTAAMQDAIGKILSLASSTGGTGLAADVDRLQRTVPELMLKGDVAKAVPSTMANMAGARQAGVMTQASVLFQLLSARHSLDDAMRQNDGLRTQATALRQPLLTLLRNVMKQGQAAQQVNAAEAGANADAGDADASNGDVGGTPDYGVGSADDDKTKKKIDTITQTFKALSAASVPVSEELLVLEQAHANMSAWRSAVAVEYSEILWSLLRRVLFIAVALGLLLLIGEIWRRLTAKYIRDMRRRRQVMVLRRFVIGFLMGIVAIFGFVTEFSSIATFAGFLTAGIAVGLQTILLSVAAYFFIVGRFGVKVGDRISISGVTGDVIDVGLVRLYMMELAGGGTELQYTGRVAVFSNSVLFQTGSPLFKQMPGTEYAWHELTVKLDAGASYGMAAQKMVSAVHKIYEGYKVQIDKQHASMERWMDLHVEAPCMESRVQFVEGALQLWARFPVEIKDASETDEKVTRALLELMAKDEQVKGAVVGAPAIRATVRG